MSDLGIPCKFCGQIANLHFRGAELLGCDACLRVVQPAERAVYNVGCDACRARVLLVTGLLDERRDVRRLVSQIADQLGHIADAMDPMNGDAIAQLVKYLHGASATLRTIVRAEEIDDATTTPVREADRDPG